MLFLSLSGGAARVQAACAAGRLTVGGQPVTYHSNPSASVYGVVVPAGLALGSQPIVYTPYEGMTPQTDTVFVASQSAGTKLYVRVMQTTGSVARPYLAPPTPMAARGTFNDIADFTNLWLDYAAAGSQDYFPGALNSNTLHGVAHASADTFNLEAVAVSAPLIGVRSIAAQRWTIRWAYNYSRGPSAQVYGQARCDLAALYVYRPGSGLIGTIFDNTADVDAAALRSFSSNLDIRGFVRTFEGNAVSFVQDGDVLVAEVVSEGWTTNVPSLPGYGDANSAFFCDGVLAPPSTDDIACTKDSAAVIEAETDIFGGGSTPPEPPTPGDSEYTYDDGWTPPNFPAFALTVIDKRQAILPVDKFEAQTAAETRVSWSSGPRYAYDLHVDGLRQAKNGNEQAAMSAFVAELGGTERTFWFTDPIDGASRLCRFDTDLSLDRIAALIWEEKQIKIASVFPDVVADVYDPNAVLSANPPRITRGGVVTPLPTLDIVITRDEVYRVTKQKDPALNEQRTGWWEAPRYPFRATFNGLRQDRNGDEVNALVALYNSTHGTLLPFWLVDPVDGEVRKVRFAEDMSLWRFANRIWASKDVKMITVVPGTGTGGGTQGPDSGGEPGGGGEPPPTPPPGTAPSVTTFAASPGTVSSGDAVVLTWSVANATKVTIDNGVGTVSATAGTVTVRPSSTVTYKLTATNADGQATATATVVVGAAPSIQPVSWWTAKFDAGWASEYAAWLADAQAANTGTLYWQGYAVDAALSYWRATGDATKVGQALALVEAAIARASTGAWLGSGAYQSWPVGSSAVGGPNSGAHSGGIYAQNLGEMSAARHWAKLVRVVLANATALAAYQTRASTVLAFIRTHVFEKWWNEGGGNLAAYLLRDDFNTGGMGAQIARELDLAVASDATWKPRWQATVTSWSAERTTGQGTWTANAAYPGARQLWYTPSHTNPGYSGSPDGRMDTDHSGQAVSTIVELLDTGHPSWGSADRAGLVGMASIAMWKANSATWTALTDGSSDAGLVDGGLAPHIGDSVARAGTFDQAAQRQLEAFVAARTSSSSYWLPSLLFAIGAFNAYRLLGGTR